jgi:hypothetical protein
LIGIRLVHGDTRFELRVVDYQFPDDATSDYDSNWLLIEGSVRHPRGDWQFRDPCLLTYEVAQLADWLEAVATGAESESWCGFIERNLRFQVVCEGAGRVLRVSFAIEALPRWAKPGEDVSVEFPVTGLNLASAVVSLREQLRKFPQRTER